MTQPLMPLNHRDLYHTGIVVADVQLAKREYTEALGVSWGLEAEREVPVLLESGPRTVTFRFAYTNEGPHRIELVQQIENTLWTTTAPGHVHHLGYWCDDLRAVSHALLQWGAPRTAAIGATTEAEPWVAVMHRLPSGAHVELVDRAREPDMFGTS